MMLKTVVFAILAVAVMANDLPSSEENHNYREMIREQCKKNNAEDKIGDVENAGKNFVNCVQGLIDVNTLQREIEEAKPKGALDEVFKKYCAKTPELKTCIYTLLDRVSPCLDVTAREQMVSAKNGTDQLIDFICYKDGDRIALFIAEGGPACFQSKLTQLKECASSIRGSVKSLSEAKTLTLAEKCGKFDELTRCVVTNLEGCDTPTPANMAESLFKYARKGSPCDTATTA